MSPHLSTVALSFCVGAAALVNAYRTLSVCNFPSMYGSSIAPPMTDVFAVLCLAYTTATIAAVAWSAYSLEWTKRLTSAVVWSAYSLERTRRLTSVRYIRIKCCMNALSIIAMVSVAVRARRAQDWDVFGILVPAMAWSLYVAIIDLLACQHLKQE